MADSADDDEREDGGAQEGDDDEGGRGNGVVSWCEVVLVALRGVATVLREFV